MSNHPLREFLLRYYYDHALNRFEQTDDVGFFCSPVSNEYSLAAEHFQLNRTDVLNISRKAINAIFGGEKEKERLRELLDEFGSAHN